MEFNRKQTARIQGLGLAVFALVVLGACSGVVITEGDTSSGSGGGGAGGAGPTSSTGTTSSTTSTTVTTTTSSTTSTGGGVVVIGEVCASDGDCGAVGHCILATEQDPVLEGGAAGGYCTRKCNADAECDFPAATCLFPASGEGPGECFKTCELGAPELVGIGDPLAPDKCNGREDLRCEEWPDGSMLCLPTCGADAQCPGGFCDLKTALCSPVPPSGKALGEGCDPSSMVGECAGLCIAIGGDKSMCTSRCVMAGALDDPYECGGPASGVCLYAASGTGVGDLAFCAESCTQQDQCQAPGFFCFNIDLPEHGVCLDTESCTSDADCGSLDTTCVTTSLGKFCMSAQYPLGTLAP